MEPTNVIPEEYLEAIEALDRRGLFVSELLGRGGAGVVFAAERKRPKEADVEGDAGNRQRVAVKLAWPWRNDAGDHDPAATKQRVCVPRFEDEARVVRYACPIDPRLCNRAITGEVRRLRETTEASVVRVLDEIQVGAHAGYVMEYVPGPRLTVTPGPALAALGRTLQRLHDEDWVHGDLKPENVRAAEGGGVRLIDPLAIGSELLTPEWTHLNFLVSTPLVDSADPRDRRAFHRHHDLVALALLTIEAFAGERPWGHVEVMRMLDRAVSMDAKRAELITARERLAELVPRVPAAVRSFVAIALEPGHWPDEGPAFAAYLQARPFETRCEALTGMRAGTLLAESCRDKG